MIEPHPVPPTPMRPVTDLLHGESVTDPYRWLEDGNSAETAAWVAAQNAHTRAALESVPGRAAIEARLTALLSIGSLGTPVVRGGRLFYTRREGSQNQPLLYVREGEQGTERVLLDPNGLAADGTIALDWWYPSPQGDLLAYGLSTRGDERSTLHILGVGGGQTLAERIPRTRAASIAWLPDASGFYYTRYPAPNPANPGAENYYRRVYLHRLGSEFNADTLVFGEQRDPADWIDASLSEDGRWLLVSVMVGWSRIDLYLRDLSQPHATFLPVVEGEDAASFGEVVDGTLYLVTNIDAPRYRLVAVDAQNPERSAWRTLIAERADAVLSSASVVGGRLALTYLRNAASELWTANLDGGNLAQVPLPGFSTISSVSGEPHAPTGYFSVTSFTEPMTVYALDMASATPREWGRIDASLDPTPYTAQQVWYESTDGKRVSMFLVHRAGLALDGSHPALLTGYGGFTISMTPQFVRHLYLWLELGGVYALPNLRGGGEYGEAWHQSGMRAHKQQTFDDFHRAAEFLIEQGYTSAGRLAILGGSNGGLLVGAALTQRPELFRAVVCAVPLLDMLRYHQFEIARLWIPEYGDPEHREEYGWLRAYSPYHHVVDGARYPAVLLTTGEADSRVDPMHARKMTARLQTASGSGLPVLLRVEPKAGHGAGKPLTKVVAEYTDLWGFICAQLAVDPSGLG